MKLSALIGKVPGAVSAIGNIDEVEIASLCVDSRRAAPGALFFCTPGLRMDAHDFAPQAVEKGAAALSGGADIVTDTNMALAGISKAGLRKLGGAAHCFMAEDFIAAAAKEQGTTRAVASMAYAAEHYPEAVYAIGNAPTALFALADRIEAGLRPALVIAVPVGFVNVVESKERLFAVCERCAVPAIAAMGRKGGSSVAAAICNALIYTAADLLDPSARGWQG